MVETQSDAVAFLTRHQQWTKTGALLSSSGRIVNTQGTLIPHDASENQQ